MNLNQDVEPGIYLGHQDPPEFSPVKKKKVEPIRSIDELLTILDAKRKTTTFEFDLDEKIGEEQLDNLFDDIQQNGCLQDDEHIKAVCQKNLQIQSFDKMGEVGSNVSTLMQVLKNKIFKPLAIEFKNETSYSEFLEQLMKGNLDRSSLFENQPLMTDFQSFKESIRNSFDDIIGKTSDVDGYQEALSQLMISVLKRCHIYWNSLRTKGEMKQSFEDLKELEKFLIQEFNQKEEFNKEILRNIIFTLKNQYFRFLNAHYQFKYLKKNLYEQTIIMMIKKYENVCESILYKNYNDVLLILDIEMQLDLLLGVMIVLYRNQYNESQIREKFQNEIYIRYMEIWNNYQKLIQYKPEIARKITEYTAMVLLRMKLRIWFFTKVHNIAEIVMQPTYYNTQKPLTTVKVYYELRDVMLVIPTHCVEFAAIKSCYLFYTNENLRNLAERYELKRTMKGAGLYSYLHAMVHILFAKIPSLLWDNYTLMKNYYYQNLFSVLQNFKQQFLINNEQTLDKLEIYMNYWIDKSRKNTKEGSDQGMVDKLDDYIYEKMLDIKAEFNNNAPFNRDATIYNDIVNEILKALKNFYLKNKNQISNITRQLISDLAKACKQWKKDTLTAPDEVIELQTHPFNERMEYPQVFHDVDNLPGLEKPEKIDFEHSDINELKKLEFTPTHQENAFVTQNEIIDTALQNGIVGADDFNSQ